MDFSGSLIFLFIHHTTPNTVDTSEPLHVIGVTRIDETKAIVIIIVNKFNAFAFSLYLFKSLLIMS